MLHCQHLIQLILGNEFRIKQNSTKRRLGAWNFLSFLFSYDVLLQDTEILILPLINKCIIDCKAVIYNFVICFPSESEGKITKYTLFFVKSNENLLLNAKNYPK